MIDLSNLWNMILTQKSWSWAVWGLADLLVFLTVRSFFFRPILKRAKALNSKWFAEVKKAYFKHSLGGWILFLVSLLLVVFAWQSGNFLAISLYEASLIGLIALSLCFAITAHLVALGVSIVQVLKQLENNQMTL